MKTFILLDNLKSKIPEKFQDTDVRYPENLVEYFLSIFTKEGDSVIDPFAGLGTTLIVSEKMSRIPYGIECDKEKCEYIKSQILHKENILLGDSMDITENIFSNCDFSISSPPYYPTDPNSSIGNGDDYVSYLGDIGNIYHRLSKCMKKGAYIVIEVSNLRDASFVPLAWDIAKEVSKYLYFEKEIIIGWGGKSSLEGEGSYGRGYDHSYCLIFQNR